MPDDTPKDWDSQYNIPLRAFHYKGYIPEECFLKGKNGRAVLKAREKLCPDMKYAKSQASRRTIWKKYLQEVYFYKIKKYNKKQIEKYKTPASHKDPKARGRAAAHEERIRANIELEKAKEEAEGEDSDFQINKRPFILTTNMKKVSLMKGKYRLLYGGTGAGKTVAVTAVYVNNMWTTPKWVVRVAGETWDNIRDSAILSFRIVMEGFGIWDDDCWRESDKTYTMPNGSEVRFISAFNIKGAAGRRADEVFLNEADLLPADWCIQMMTRARSHVWLDFNPRERGWVNDRIINNPDLVKDLDILTELTYKGNETLKESEIQGFNLYKHDKALYDTYILGKFGDFSSKIYRGWTKFRYTSIDKTNRIPKGAKLMYRGVDFGGFGKDTSHMAVVAVYKFWHSDVGEAWLIDEEHYSNQTTMEQLAHMLLAWEQSKPALTIVDGKNEYWVRDLRERGCNIITAGQKPGSVLQGIKWIQAQRILVTEDSYNLLKEYDTYFFKKDRYGNIVRPEVPNEKIYCDSMDALRYAFDLLITAKFGMGQKNAFNDVNNSSNFQIM